MNTHIVAGAALLAILLAGCGEDSSTTRRPPAPDPTLVVPTPSPDPADFVDTVDNPYFPLAPGTRWVYEVTSEEGNQRIVVHVTDQTKVVAGVPVTVVRDTATAADGAVLEDTFDYYAQDTSGNVWYFGEDTKAYDGKKVSTEGSWETGVDGGQAGILMLADPQPGDAYAQEYYKDVAEDQGKVLAVDATASVPFGDFTDLVQTEDTTPLEPDVLEQKYYARGIGIVMEKDITGGDEVVRLLRMTTP